MTRINDVIPTYVPDFQPYFRLSGGLVILTLPDINGVMVNVELSPARHAKLMQDGLVVCGEIVARASPKAT